MTTRIGILAGYGRLPIAFAIEAKRAGLEVAAIGITPDVDPELCEHVAGLQQLSIGCWQKVIDALRKAQVHDLYLLGKVNKSFLFSGAPVDSRFIRVVSSVRERSDDSIILAFVADLEAEGFVIREQDRLLPALMPQEGLVAGNPPSEQEWHDIEFGFRMARGIAALDIGQTCVVKDGAVLAVEAIEGTDACIRRGGQLGKSGTVVVKVAKPNQDPRFDVPTVGVDTLMSMQEAGARVLAFQAGATFVVDQAKMCTYATEHGMTLVSYERGRQRHEGDDSCR